MDNDKYAPVPLDLDKLREIVLSTEEGRQAYAEAVEEFAVIDAAQKSASRIARAPVKPIANNVKPSRVME